MRFYRDYAGGRDFDAFFLRDRVFFGRTGTACSRASSAATWSRSAPPASSPTRRSSCTTRASGTNERRRRSACTAARVQHDPGRAVRGAAPDPHPVQRPGQRLLPLRPRPLRLRVRQQRPAHRRATVCSGPNGIGEAGPPKEALQHAGTFVGSARRSSASARRARRSKRTFATLVGEQNFIAGMAEHDEHRLTSPDPHVLRKGHARSASLRDIEESDAVLVLGEDVTNTAPMLALALRQSVRRQPMEVAEKLHIPGWDDTACAHGGAGAKGAALRRVGREHAAGRHRDGHVSRRPRRGGATSASTLRMGSAGPRPAMAPGEAALAIGTRIARRGNAVGRRRAGSRQRRP